MSAETDIRELLQMATPVPLIFADENGPRPPKPYATVATRWANRPRENYSRLDDNGVRTTESHRDASVEIHGYGAGIFEALDILSQMLDTEAILQATVARNIAFWDIGQVTRLPTLRDGSTYEPHAVIEISARYVLGVTEQLDFIEHVEGSIDTVGGLKDDELPPFEFTVDIPPP
jgi:hypothetical protein